MYPPHDFNVCLLAVILTNYQRQEAGAVAPKPTRPEWARTPDQEVIRALSTRMAP